MMSSEEKPNLIRFLHDIRTNSSELFFEHKKKVFLIYDRMTYPSMFDETQYAREGQYKTNVLEVSKVINKLNYKGEVFLPWTHL